MIVDIKVPSPGESVTQVQLANWLVNNGEFVSKNTELAEIDSDKATLTVSTEYDGVIKILVQAGDTIEVGTVIATIDTEAAGKPKDRTSSGPVQMTDKKAAPGFVEPMEISKHSDVKRDTSLKQGELHISPLARKLLESNGLTETDFIEGLKAIRFGKNDIEDFLARTAEKNQNGQDPQQKGERKTERKKMTTLRLKISERLVSVKNETAMLTTFNEVNMSAIMDIRKKYKEIFKEKHGLTLGFMSFFTKAVTETLKSFPDVNAMIDGDEVVYHHYVDIGIAVSTPKGLMVPVIRNAGELSLAQIESAIRDYAEKARNNKLSIDDMSGGTFTITNGGVFGSMLSTPIINPPQSAILGMHNIVERPVAVNGKVEIHPVMYVALSYDHRIIDGRESVSFLVRVKEMLENPVKMLFNGHDPIKTLLDI